MTAHDNKLDHQRLYQASDFNHQALQGFCVRFVSTWLSMSFRTTEGDMAYGDLPMLKRVILMALLAISPWCGARAQQPGIVGTWSWDSPTPQGPIRNTLLLRGDGRYVQVVQLPVGSLMRQAGQYRATPISANRFRLQLQVQSWAPHASCVVIAGFGRRCQPVIPPPSLSDIVTVTSPSTMALDGLTLQRDEQAFLLRETVPDPSVMFGRTPVVPSIRQPVMPPMAGYQTPNGPGNVAAGQYHQQNEQWRNTYMRGCQQAENGQYYACEQ